MMFRRFLKRDTVNDTPTTTDTADDPAARKGPPGFAPILLPRDQHGAPMPMHFRVWRHASDALELIGAFEGAAWLRLDYIAERRPHPNPTVPVPVTNVIGANVMIAGPAAGAGNAFGADWMRALADPIAIEVWSSNPIRRGSLNAAGRTHTYGVLPLLRADANAQQQRPKYNAGRGRNYAAWRFRAEPGNTWGTGPMPVRYSRSTRRPEHIHPLSERFMWLMMSTDMPPAEALAIGTDTYQGAHRADQ